MDANNYITNEWEYILTLLPDDLDASAFANGAILRKRGVKSAAALLRLVMAYAVCGLALKDISAWASQAGIAELSSVAAQKRFKHCSKWLGFLLTQYLARRMNLKSFTGKHVRLRISDASVLTRPGAKGTDFRLHTGFDLSSLTIDHIELTGPEAGENLARYPAREGEVIIADRVYGRSGGIVSVVRSLADVIVRLTCNNLPLLHPDGRKFDILGELRSLKPCEVRDFDVKTAPSPKGDLPSVPGRLVALRKSPEAADRSREELKKRMRKKGKTPQSAALEACGYFFLFTTLEANRFSASEILELYRFRWQIEIAFKRMKGIIKIDDIPTKTDELCRTFILAKLLAALLVEDLSLRMEAFSPWGYEEPISGLDQSPVSRAA